MHCSVSNFNLNNSSKNDNTYVNENTDELYTLTIVIYDNSYQINNLFPYMDEYEHYKILSSINVVWNLMNMVNNALSQSFTLVMVNSGFILFMFILHQR